MTEKLLLFNRWDISEVKVDDPGLKNHINLDPILIPRTGGRFATKPFQKEKISIVERLMNKLMVSGHRGKKHKLTSGHQAGNVQVLYKIIKKAFEIIEKRTKKNPVQVLVNAIENAALLEEVASYRLGGIIARSSVVVSPQRRIDLALRHISQGIQKASFKTNKSLAEVISDELISASNNDSKSFAIQERNRIEREAEGAR
ncbi:MAG: 30S ribosomal protein S7 [Candidatus Aenigmatarchaeota archaeon]|nr:MAG: 30S ribosomal protein S7 [Candidatus Aenigmarchaeota archaeon]